MRELCTSKRNLLYYSHLAKLSKNISSDCLYYIFGKITTGSCKALLMLNSYVIFYIKPSTFNGSFRRKGL